MQSKGYVSYAGSKPFGSKVLYSFRLKNEDKWFGCGSVNPNVSTGDHIEFDYSEKNGRYEVNVSSLKKLDSNAEVHQGTPSRDFKATNSGVMGKEDYWNDRAEKDAEKDLRIQWQSARNAAIEMVGILVSGGHIVLPSKNASDAILGKVSDLTERFYKESASPPDVVGNLASVADESEILNS